MDWVEVLILVWVELDCVELDLVEPFVTVELD